MPIYAYKCDSCGHSLEILQKMSDPPARDCPSCGAASLVKQVTAAGFQLKGSGWYVTDFRGGQSASSASDKPEEGGAGKASDKPADGSAPSAPATGGAAGTAEKPVASAPAGASTAAAETKTSPVVKSGSSGQ